MLQFSNRRKFEYWSNKGLIGIVVEGFLEEYLLKNIDQCLGLGVVIGNQAFKVRLPKSKDDIFWGFVGQKPGNIGIIRHGALQVMPDTPVKRGNQVFIRHVKKNKQDQLGAVCNGKEKNTSLQAGGWIFAGSAEAGEIVKIKRIRDFL